MENNVGETTNVIHGEGPVSSVSQCPGQTVIPSVVGIIATSLLLLKLLLAGLISTKPWEHDPVLIDLPWGESKSTDAAAECQVSGQHTLCFGILTSDGVVSPHPPIKRAMRIVIDALRKAGHQVSKSSSLRGTLISLDDRQLNGSRHLMVNQTLST